jgi:hypothetical protein
MSSMPVTRWGVIGATAQGASHRRKRNPNQDAWLRTGTRDEPLAVAVADGHSDPTCFRADRGSLLAVQTATSVIRAFLARPDIRALSAAELEPAAAAELPRLIMAGWRQAVAEDIGKLPFDEAETSRLIDGPGRDERPYGATLLVAGIADDRLLYAQIGDGDALLMERSGQIRKLTRDERLHGNVTTSLCLTSAEEDFRLTVVDLRAELPRLLFLATDGYGNSYPAQDGLAGVVTDLEQMLDRRGPDWIESQLEQWLEEITTRGSGDDITAALAWPLADGAIGTAAAAGGGGAARPR